MHIPTANPWVNTNAYFVPRTNFPSDASTDGIQSFQDNLPNYQNNGIESSRSSYTLQYMSRGDIFRVGHPCP